MRYCDGERSLKRIPYYLEERTVENEEELSFNQHIIRGACYSYGKAVLAQLLVKCT
jgi:hypothetical protein